ncbi:IclR family transcriptional regulator, partial [Micromonospora sp. NPDC005113]
MRGNERLLSILTTLGATGGQTLSEVADGVGLPRPTALRFLRSLEQDGWVTRDGDGRYALGPAVLAMAGQYLSRDAVLAAAAPIMQRLRDELGETISLSRIAGHRRICVQEVPSLERLRLVLGLGTYGPLHAGASGIVLLAALPDHARQEVLKSPLDAFTERSMTSVDELERECERVREQGWAVTRGQRTAGGVAVAVPVRDSAAPYGVSALGVYGPDARCSRDEERRWLDALRE